MINKITPKNNINRTYQVLCLLFLLGFSALVSAKIEKSGKVEKIVLTDYGDNEAWLSEKGKGEIGTDVVTIYDWRAFEHKGIKHFNVYLYPVNKTNVLQYYQFIINFYDEKNNVLGRDINYSGKVDPNLDSNVMISTRIPFQDWAKVSRYRIKYNVTSINPDTYNYNANLEQQAFLKKVVAAINANDKAAYKDLIHSSYKQCTNKGYAKDVQEYYINHMLSHTIPDAYKAGKRPPKDLMTLEKTFRFNYPIQPQFQLQAIFDKQSHASKCNPNTRIGQVGLKVGPLVVKDKGRYWISQPCLLESQASFSREFISNKKKRDDSVKAQRNKLDKKDVDYIIETALNQGEAKAKSLLESKYHIKDRIVRYYVYKDICQK